MLTSKREKPSGSSDTEGLLLLVLGLPARELYHVVEQLTNTMVCDSCEDCDDKRGNPVHTYTSFRIKRTEKKP